MGNLQQKLAQLEKEKQRRKLPICIETGQCMESDPCQHHVVVYAFGVEILRARMDQPEIAALCRQYGLTVPLHFIIEISFFQMGNTQKNKPLVTIEADTMCLQTSPCQHNGIVYENGSVKMHRRMFYPDM